MLTLTGVNRVLCIGAHSDDIEIGCGGTVRRLLESNADVEVHWHVFSAPGRRRQEATRSAREWLRGAGRSRIRIWSFKESYFPAQWSRIKDALQSIAKDCNPDLIFTHARDDRHQDHRVLSDLTWNAFRNHDVLEYEIPKYDGDLGQPNVYVALPPAVCRGKVDGLMRHFASQQSKAWFTEDTFLGLMRLRGIECGGRATHAEGFVARKLVL